MANAKDFTVVGAFQNRGQAQAAVDALRAAGFADEDIGIAARDDVPPRPGVEPAGNRLEDMAAAGAAAGGTLGALAGALATGLIPGIGQVIAAGLLAGILGGTVLGAATGSMIGALIGLGMPEEAARYYDREFLAGRVIVAVRAAGRSAEAADFLRRAGAYSVATADQPSSPQSATAPRLRTEAPQVNRPRPSGS